MTIKIINISVTACSKTILTLIKFKTYKLVPTLTSAEKLEYFYLELVSNIFKIKLLNEIYFSFTI